MVASYASQAIVWGPNFKREEPKKAMPPKLWVLFVIGPEFNGDMSIISNLILVCE